MISSKIRSWASLALVILAFTHPIEANAQQTNRQPTPNDTLKSTEVAADKKVTFRIYAPKAAEVSVRGDFGRGGTMSKDDKGVWSLTVGPLTPDFYTYTFTVDDVRTVDPKNPMVKPGLGSVDSMFLVPGDEAEFEDAKDVPHGDVRTVWYRSSTLAMPPTARWLSRLMFLNLRLNTRTTSAIGGITTNVMSVSFQLDVSRTASSATTVTPSRTSTVSTLVEASARLLTS